MMSSTMEKTELWWGDRVREYFVERKALGGLIHWQEITHRTRLGTELHIFADSSIKVFLNGEELPSNKGKER